MSFFPPKKLFAGLFLCCSYSLQSFAQIPFNAFSKPIIAAHRGGFYEKQPENSLEAFKETAQQINRQPFFIELDLRESVNERIYVLHDETFDRTSTGAGLIKRTDDYFIKNFSLKNRAGEVTPYKIPTFEEVLQWAKTQKNLYLMIDVKGTSWERAIDFVDFYEVRAKCLFLTFNLQDTQKVFKLAPSAMISVLITTTEELNELKALQIPKNQLFIYINPRTTKATLKQIHQEKFICMTDVSENSKQTTKPFANPFKKHFYRKICRSKQLDVLITDYPVVVNRIFAKRKSK